MKMRRTDRMGGRGMAAGWLVLGLVMMASWPTVATALTDKELDQRVREVSDGLRCPTCQAISVNDSEAAFSRQIRDKVRRMLVEGQNEEDIKAYFVSRYGEWILRAPKKEGLGLVLWVLPFAGLVFGGGLIFYQAQRRAASHKQAAEQETASGISEEQRKRINADLKAFEEEE